MDVRRRRAAILNDEVVAPVRLDGADMSFGTVPTLKQARPAVVKMLKTTTQFLRDIPAVARAHLITALVVAVTMCARPATAQSTDEPDPAKVRLRVGPLWMNPTVAMTNIGVDNNVFNEPAQQNPKSDFTFTLTPAVDLWLRVGDTWVVGRIVEDLIWYDTYASERNASTGYTVGWRVPLARFGFKIDASRRNARDRPNLEIDTRAERAETKVTGLVEYRMLSKTYVGVILERQGTDYDGEEFYNGANLQSELDHTTTGGGLSLRYQLTPLTSLSLTATRKDDRFKYSPLRNSSQSSVSGSIFLDKFALIRGSATFGYTDFRPDLQTLQAYRGPTASASLSYTLLEATRFTFDLGRDVQYSYDVSQAYYVQTRVGGSIQQQILGPVDAVARGSFATLAYTDRQAIGVTVSGRVDDVSSYGGGVGYRLGRDVRLGFNIDHTNRASDDASHRYSDLVFGGSVTYGF